jgi:hypothetical protein
MFGRKVNVHTTGAHQIRFTGVFDLDRLYSELCNWLKTHDYDFYESKHADKDNPRGKEIQYVIEGEREVTDYFKYYLKMFLFIQYLNPVSDNLVKGVVKLNFSGYVALDWAGKWGHTAFTNFLFKIYNNHVIKAKIERHRSILFGDLSEFQDVAKDVLEFNR